MTWLLVGVFVIYAGYRGVETWREIFRPDLGSSIELGDNHDEDDRFATFTYVDRYGVVTNRVICDWHEDGHYIHGRCLTAQAERTFRKDRIENWSETD